MMRGGTGLEDTGGGASGPAGVTASTRRSSRLLLLASMLLVPLAIAWAAVASIGQTIEGDLTERSRQALTRADLDIVAVRFHGRDGVLTGVPRSRRAVAAAAVAEVDGVRVVKLADTTGRLDFTVDGGVLTISGTVPDQRARTVVLRQARPYVGGRKLVDALEVREGVLLPGNPRVTGALVDWLAPDWEGDRRLTWDADGVRITGEVPDDEARSAVADGLAEALPGIPVRCELRSEEAELRVRIAEYLAGNPIEFRPDTADMTANGRAAAGYVAGLLAAAPQVLVRVDGHVTRGPDPGSSAYQRELSEQRAEAVTALLVSRGVAAERITSRGLGQDGRDPGRRADITVL